MMSKSIESTGTPAGDRRIGLVSDIHQTRSADPEKRAYRERFARTIAAVNAEDVDMVLIAGDLADDGLPEQFADFREQVEGFTAPVRWVPGNHDIGAKFGIVAPGDPLAADVVTSERIARFETALSSSIPFSETIAGLRLIGINASILGSGLPEEAAQWRFLEEAFAPPSSLPTILLMHYPLYVEQPDESGGGYWNVEPEPRARLLSLLDRDGSVRAVLSGHVHRSLRQMRNGVLLYTTPPVAFGLPRGEQAEGWTLVTVPLESDLPVSAQFRPISSALPSERSQ